jgi:hypothetical protein
MYAVPVVGSSRVTTALRTDNRCTLRVAHCGLEVCFASPSSGESSIPGPMARRSISHVKSPPAKLIYEARCLPTVATS